MSRSSWPALARQSRGPSSDPVGNTAWLPDRGTRDLPAGCAAAAALSLRGGHTARGAAGIPARTHRFAGRPRGLGLGRGADGPEVVRQESRPVAAGEPGAAAKLAGARLQLPPGLRGAADRLRTRTCLEAGLPARRGSSRFEWPGGRLRSLPRRARGDGRALPRVRSLVPARASGEPLRDRPRRGAGRGGLRHRGVPAHAAARRRDPRPPHRRPGRRPDGSGPRRDGTRGGRPAREPGSRGSRLRPPLLQAQALGRDPGGPGDGCGVSRGCWTSSRATTS